jgi:DNA-binding CsgD family transcriptional regulator
MSLRYRSMQPNDVDACVRIFAEHPVIGPRYGKAIRDLRLAWRRLVGCEAMTTAVNDDFMREVKTSPLFWFGPELARRVMKGSSPVLSDKQVRGANSGEGLNLLVWDAVPCAEFTKRPEIYHLMVRAFLELYRGFLLKEMMTSQSETAERLQWAVDAGGLLWDPANGRYVKSLKGNADEFVREPHIVGLTRDLELGRPGSWVGVLFNYEPPKIGFSRGEQRLLLAALSGATDEKLAEELRTSPNTVKNTWRSIYDRAGSHLPELFSDDSQSNLRSERGKEKRRHLLAYLREHPEELRPVSRKLLRPRT